MKYCTISCFIMWKNKTWGKLLLSLDKRVGLVWKCFCSWQYFTIFKIFFGCKGSEIQRIPSLSKPTGMPWIVMESFESLILQTQKILFMVKYYQKQKHYHTRPTLLSKDNNAFPQVLFFYIMKQEMVQYFIIFNTKRQKITLTYWTVFSSLRKEIL